MQNNNYPTSNGTDNPQLSFSNDPNADNKNERSSRQMNLTERLVANSATPKKENTENTGEHKNESAAKTEEAKKEATSEDKAAISKATAKSTKGGKRKKELTPDEEEKAILKKIAKKKAEKAELENELTAVRNKKRENDLKNIHKICSEKDIPLSDLIAFLKHLKNVDTLKMLTSEISVRSKTVKKEAPPAEKTG